MKKQVSNKSKIPAKQLAVRPTLRRTHLPASQANGTTATQQARLGPASLTPAEVLQLQRTLGNQAVDQFRAGAIQPRPVQAKRSDQPGGQPILQSRSVSPGLALPPVQSGSLSRSEFDGLMQQHFGVGRVFNGSRTDQENELRQTPGNSSLAFNPPDWQDWNPGSDSTLYAQIANAFRQYAETFGGIPPVQEIGFFNVRYAYDHTSARVVTERNVPAVFGGGTLLIYRYITTSAKALPTGRSTSGKAPLPLPLREDTVSRIITHELAHGLVEVALTPASTGGAAGQAPDPQLLTDYKTAVGWTAGAAPRLFDIGAPAVQQAIAAGTVPDSTYEITQANWNEPRWIEQPISSYMTTHPAEDFPEAVMAYVVQPDLLRTRSPRRFQFIATRANRLGPLLRQIGPASR